MTNPIAPSPLYFGLLRLTAPLAASVLAVALAGAPAPAAEAPSPAAACAAFRDAVRDSKAPMAPLLERPDVARQAVIGCRRHDGAPEDAAALGFALIAAGEAGGVPLVRAAAEAGVGEAQYWLALWSKDGLALDGRAVLAPNTVDRMRLLRAAAERGHPLAQAALGAAFLVGEEIAQDVEQALYWHRKAAAQDVPHALLALGMMHRNGAAGLAPDREKSMDLIRRAADLGDATAQWLLALWTTSGSPHTGQTIPEALDALERLSKAGDMRAVATLGGLYWYGHDVPQDRAYAREIFCRGGKEGGVAFEALGAGPLTCPDPIAPALKKGDEL
ncbi:MAG: sel1 repeat family protein [Alphaproteobacteria bacterium]|nr:sel1 repeat family protein [Alphaproteobacteria bacterium]